MIRQRKRISADRGVGEEVGVKEVQYEGKTLVEAIV